MEGLYFGLNRYQVVTNTKFNFIKFVFVQGDAFSVNTMDSDLVANKRTGIAS